MKSKHLILIYLDVFVNHFQSMVSCLITEQTKIQKKNELTELDKVSLVLSMFQLGLSVSVRTVSRATTIHCMAMSLMSITSLSFK